MFPNRSNPGPVERFGWAYRSGSGREKEHGDDQGGGGNKGEGSTKSGGMRKRPPLVKAGPHNFVGGTSVCVGCESGKRGREEWAGRESTDLN